MVTDFHYFKHLRHKSAGWEWKDSLFELMTQSKWGFDDLSANWRDPLILQKWSNQIRASSCSLRQNTASIAETDEWTRSHGNLLVLLRFYTQGCKWMQVSFPLACNTQSIIMEKTHKFTFYTLITLWMLCTIVLNLRPAFVMLDPIYINM